MSARDFSDSVGGPSIADLDEGDWGRCPRCRLIYELSGADLCELCLSQPASCRVCGLVATVRDLDTESCCADCEPGYLSPAEELR